MMDVIEDLPANKADFVVNSDGSITIDDITIPPAPIPALTNDATTERLIITELNVRDFKSYAGNRTIGPFNKNFSCIVGPNGSGKSNVIDALLFVFGYRAQRIRSKKVSVLIHKSHKFPDLNSCSVSVNFATIKDEGANFTVLPGSEFSVKRTGYKDNSSAYEICGRRSQYKEVGALLRQYGIDLDYNRFMILQGEIELISMMKPKSPNENDHGMLEYIEDIIGSHRFIEPIKHFNEKVEQLNEIRMNKYNHLKLVEKERADAEKPRNKAMEYIRSSNKLTLLENSVLQAQIAFSMEDSQKLIEKKNTVAGKIKDVSTDLDQLQEAKECKEAEMKVISSEYETCCKNVDSLKQQFTDLEREDAACRENIKNNKEKLKKVEKSLQSEESKIINLRSQPATLQKEIDELKEKRQKLEADKVAEEDRLAEVMGSMKEEIQGYQEEKDALENDLVELKNTVYQKKSELDLAQSELDICLSSERKEKESLVALENDFNNLSQMIKEEQKSLKDTSERLPELTSQLTAAKEKLVCSNEKENSYTELLKIKRSTLDEAKNSLSLSQNRNTLVNAFLEQKKKGKLTGVYGRLGDLGAIDSKYDIAISTACGALDNIVTDTISTAQECVEYLKANDLGYATFIALEKVQVWEPYTRQKINTPENVPRLFDLISVKDKAVLPAFYFALQDTLVANDLEQATRVGLGGSTRYRMVTLKGQLIDLSGTMTGGGNKALKGRMGQAVVDNTCSQSEIDNMAAEIEALVKSLNEVKMLKIELKEFIEEKEKEVSSLQHLMKKSKLNYDGYKERENMLIKQKDEQKLKIILAAPDQNKISELQTLIKKNEKRYNNASDEASVVENKVKNLQEQILAITKGKYGAAQKKVEKLAKEINQISQNITKVNGMLKNSDRNLKKAEEKISGLKKEVEDCLILKENFIKEYKALESKGLDVTSKKKEAEEALLTCELLKTKSSTEIKEFSSRIHQLKSEIIEFKNQIKMVDIDVRANEGQIKTLKQKLEKLELHNIEEGPTELPILSPEELNEVAVNSLQIDIGRLQAQIKDMNPDLGAIAEFKRKEEQYKRKLKDLEDTVAERDHYRQHYESLRQLRLQEFMRGFNIITLKVKELYQMMTLGGDAELELVDSIDPFSEGIEFSVRPLRKSWKSIRNLSGGEKTLSSLSLVFALHFYRTTPFFVMDEIDAALDFRNVSIIGSYIKDCTKNSQFIVISLRENMFLLADHLIGIFKTNNRTNNVYLSPPPDELAKSNLSPIKNKNNAFDDLKKQKPLNDKDVVTNEMVSSNSNVVKEKIEESTVIDTEKSINEEQAHSNQQNTCVENEDSDDSFVFKTPAAKSVGIKRISFFDEVQPLKKRSFPDENAISDNLKKTKTPAKTPRSMSTSAMKSNKKTPKTKSVNFDDKEDIPSSIRKSQRLRTPKTQEKIQSAKGKGALDKMSANKKSILNNANKSASKPKKVSVGHSVSSFIAWSDDDDEENIVIKTPTTRVPKLKTSIARVSILNPDDDL